MNDLPPDIAATLAKGIAAYVRATPATELPTSLAPLKKTAQTQKGLARHRAQLLAVLEDDALRALIVEWLEDSKPRLTKDEVSALKLAAEQPEGWRDRLAEGSKKKPVDTAAASPKLKELEAKLAKEKEAHRKTKEEVRAMKEDGLNKIRVERARSLRLDEEVTALRDSQRDWKGEAAAQTSKAERLEKTVERERRKTKADLEALREQVKQLRGENRDLKKRLADAEKAAAAAAAPAPKPKRADAVPASKAEPSGPRPQLKAPKGRLEEDPATLDEWLATQDVTLVVDGYNVTHSPNGFPQLALEQQRSRLREMLKTFSNRRQVQIVLVWDGGEAPPGTKRMSSRYLTEEYSEPDRSGTGQDKDRADRHIVELLQKLPPHPVVLATNDRGLQEAAGEEGATIATSDQLLALLR